MANIAHYPYTETRTLCGMHHPPNPPPGNARNIVMCNTCVLKKKKLDMGLFKLKAFA